MEKMNEAVIELNHNTGNFYVAKIAKTTDYIVVP